MKNTLKSLGLTQREAEAYLGLYNFKETTATQLAKITKEHRTNIYDCLNRLIEKGVVSYFREKDKKLFEAADPEMLKNILKEKELNLNSILPELKLKNELAVKKSEAHIFEGIVSIRNMLNHFLEAGKTRYAYGSPITASKMLGDYFLESYHRKRLSKKLKLFLIYNSDAKERINHLNSLELTESRFLPKEYDSPVTTNICGDEVVIFLYSKKPLAIQIRNSQIAEAYKKYFDLLWRLAHKKA